MAYQEKQLGQRRDNDTDTHSVYSPASGITAIITTIMLANTSDKSATVRVFIDDDGTTYNQTTALVYDIVIPRGATEDIRGFFPMNNSDGNLAYQQGTANAITITIFGTEIG
jgi:hypothetical protein